MNREVLHAVGADFMLNDIFQSPLFLFFFDLPFVRLCLSFVGKLEILLIKIAKKAPFRLLFVF